MIKEVAVGSISEAIQAEFQGADRIELCDNLLEGGTTPSYGTIVQAKKALHIPLVVMIRPRGGNFIYTDLEFNTMLEDIKICADLNVDSIAIGMLTKDNQVDWPKLKQVLAIKKNLKITFHKAIDEVDDYQKTVLKLHELRVDRILTSGKAQKAIDGLALINTIDQIADLEVVVAGKVTADNIDYLKDNLNTLSFHGKNIL